MKFFRELNQFMMAGAKAHARWELEMSNNILKSRKRLLVLGLLLIPVFLGGMAFADSVASAMPGFPGTSSGASGFSTNWVMRKLSSTDITP